MSPTKVHKERSAGEIEIDFTKMALQTRERVTQTLGPPKREQKPEGAVFRYSFYQWSFAYYEQGRLKAFEYEYKRTPSNINDALEKVGLKQTSQPREDLFIISWSAKSGPLVCCGFEMESVVLMRDLSKITVRFNRKIDSLK